MKIQLIKIFIFVISLCLSTSQIFAQSAMDFDGIDDYITAPNASSLIANKSISLAFWVYPTNPNPGFPNFDGMAGFRNNSNADFFILHLSTNTVEARFRNSSGSNFDIVYNGLNLNTWNHFVMTYDGSTLELYHDGVSVGTQAANGFITSTTETLYMGNLVFQTTNFYLGGQLDDVCLWSRALSSTEVGNLYTACAINLNSTNLELCYEFNEGVGNGNNTGITSILDSKNNINGVINGLALTGTLSNFVPYSQNSFQTINASTCNGSYVSPSGNHTWTMSGTYHDTIPSANPNGCDSIYTINLLVGSSSNNTTISPSACVNYVSPSGNYIWNMTGTYTDTLQSVAGCDSIITINLTINSNTGSLTTSACGSYTAPSGNNTWTTSGTYTDILTNSLGCDSTITINLTIVDLPDTMVTVSQNTDTLMANLAGATYQWLDCDNGYMPVAGATNQMFVPSNNSNYAVAVTMNGCTDTSGCHAVMPVSTFGIFTQSITLYPNPTLGQIQLDLGQVYKEITIQITDVSGKVVQNRHFNGQQLIQLELNQAAGVYFIEAIGDDKRGVFKVVKE